VGKYKTRLDNTFPVCDFTYKAESHETYVSFNIADTRKKFEMDKTGQHNIHRKSGRFTETFFRQGTSLASGNNFS
jgi:ssDNA-binding Zn-finger/Zn-ribbon topoisomerase 1